MVDGGEPGDDSRNEGKHTGRNDLIFVEKDGSDVTRFGNFDNSTCKRVLDLLEPGDLRLGQVVIKRVAVVKLGMNNGSGVGGSCFGVEVWADTAKLTNMVIARFGDR